MNCRGTDESQDVPLSMRVVNLVNRANTRRAYASPLACRIIRPNSGRDMMSAQRLFALGIMATLLITSQSTLADDAFRLTLRSRLKSDTPDSSKPVIKTVEWNPKATAIIVCDMWDRHWCKSAERRVGELAGPMNEMLKQARSRG